MRGQMSRNLQSDILISQNSYLLQIKYSLILSASSNTPLTFHPHIWQTAFSLPQSHASHDTVKNIIISNPICKFNVNRWIPNFHQFQIHKQSSRPAIFVSSCQVWDKFLIPILPSHPIFHHIYSLSLFLFLRFYNRYSKHFRKISC